MDFLKNNTDQAKLSFAKIWKGPGINGDMVIYSSVPAAGSTLPASQSGTDLSPQANSFVCGGTGKLIGSIWGFLKNDELASAASAAYCTGGGVIYYKLTAGVTPAAGQPAYIVESTGLLHDTPGAGKTPVGWFLRSSYDTDPTNYPTGNWTEFQFVNGLSTEALS